MGYWGHYILPGTKKDAVHEVRRGAGHLRLYWLLAAAVLLLSGAMYRAQVARLYRGTNVRTLPAIQLSTLPFQIGDWIGEDTPLREDVRRAAKVDDSLSRLYVSRSANRWANIYAALSVRPANMIGHKPEVCYVSAGWVLECAEESRIRSVRGTEMPCRLHVFRRMTPYEERLVVLSYYVLDGDVVCTEEAFSGVEWRGAGPAGGGHYVAQIQVSSTMENSARAFAERVTESILEMLPDKDGLVKDGRYSTFQDKRGAWGEGGAAR